MVHSELSGSFLCSAMYMDLLSRNSLGIKLSYLAKTDMFLVRYSSLMCSLSKSISQSRTF